MTSPITVADRVPVTAVLKQIKSWKVVPTVMPRNYRFYRLRSTPYIIGITELSEKALMAAKKVDDQKRLLGRLMQPERKAARSNMPSPGSMLLIIQDRDGTMRQVTADNRMQEQAQARAQTKKANIPLSSIGNFGGAVAGGLGMGLYRGSQALRQGEGLGYAAQQAIGGGLQGAAMGHGAQSLAQHGYDPRLRNAALLGAATGGASAFHGASEEGRSISDRIRAGLAGSVTGGLSGYGVGAAFMRAPGAAASPEANPAAPAAPPPPAAAPPPPPPPAAAPAAAPAPAPEQRVRPNPNRNPKHVQILDRDGYSLIDAPWEHGAPAAAPAPAAPASTPNQPRLYSPPPPGVPPVPEGIVNRYPAGTPNQPRLYSPPPPGPGDVVDRNTQFLARKKKPVPRQEVHPSALAGMESRDNIALFGLGPPPTKAASAFKKPLIDLIRGRNVKQITLRRS
jgi:hypothetical protein